MQQVILRLLHGRTDQVVFFSEFCRFQDAFCRPLGSAPIESLALLDDLIESPDGLADRGFKVWTMGEDQVHIIELEIPQRAVYSFDDVLVG